MSKYIVVDIDGTIADCSARAKYLEQTPKDWGGFYAGIAGDKPIVPILDALAVLDDSDEYDVVFCTGRDEAYRQATHDWLWRKAECYVNAKQLLMRPAGDRRSDEIVKPELLAARGITPDNTAFILEDRAKVVRRWRDLGFRCLQVADGDF